MTALLRLSLSFVFAVCLLATSASAQMIPNGSFEEWASDGNPVGWTTSNSPNLITITRSELHTDGQFSAHAEPNGSTPQLRQKFAISGRPEALNGFLASELIGNASVYVRIEVTKGKTQIAIGQQYLTGSSSSFRSFSVPIGYPLGAPEPDSAQIFILMASQTEGSSFTVDELSFGARAADVEEHSPSTGLSVIDRGSSYDIAFELPTASHAVLEIFDMQGRAVEKLFDGVTSGTIVQWEKLRMPGGLYLCRLITESGVMTKKISVLR